MNNMIYKQANKKLQKLALDDILNTAYIYIKQTK